MKKVSGLICAAISLSLLAGCSEEEKMAKPEVKQEEKQQTEEATETTETTETTDSTETTETVSAEDLPETFAFFPSRKLEEDFKALVGEDFKIFEMTFDQVQAIPTSTEDEKAYHGIVPGLEGAAEAVIIFNEKEGKIWAATTEGENLNVYQNGSDQDKNNPTFETWKEKFTEHTVVNK